MELPWGSGDLDRVHGAVAGTAFDLKGTMATNSRGREGFGRGGTRCKDVGDATDRQISSLGVQGGGCDGGSVQGCDYGYGGGQQHVHDVVYKYPGSCAMPNGDASLQGGANLERQQPLRVRNNSSYISCETYGLWQLEGGCGGVRESARQHHGHIGIHERTGGGGCADVVGGRSIESCGQNGQAEGCRGWVGEGWGLSGTHLNSQQYIVGFNVPDHPSRDSMGLDPGVDEVVCGSTGVQSKNAINRGRTDLDTCTSMARTVNDGEFSPEYGLTDRRYGCEHEHVVAAADKYALQVGGRGSAAAVPTADGDAFVNKECKGEMGVGLSSGMDLKGNIRELFSRGFDTFTSFDDDKASFVDKRSLMQHDKENQCRQYHDLPWLPVPGFGRRMAKQTKVKGGDSTVHRVGTINLRSIRSVDRQLAFCALLDCHAPGSHVTTLTETWWGLSSGAYELGGGDKPHKLFVGPAKRGSGVGFIIPSESTQRYKAVRFRALGTRVAELRYEFGSIRWCNIVVYFPPRSVEADEADKVGQLYDQISRLIRAARSRREVVLLSGDFNVDIGRPQDRDHELVGAREEGPRSNDAQDLVHFAVNHKLGIANRLRVDAGPDTTRKAPNNRPTQLDYIMVDHKVTVAHVTVTHEAWLASDHALVEADLDCNLKSTRRSKPDRPSARWQFHVPAGATAEGKTRLEETFAEEVRHALTNLHTGDAKGDVLTDWVKEVVATAGRWKKPQYKADTDWISMETREAVNKMIRIWKTAPWTETSKQARREVFRLTRRDRRRYATAHIETCLQDPAHWKYIASVIQTPVRSTGLTSMAPDAHRFANTFSLTFRDDDNRDKYKLEPLEVELISPDEAVSAINREKPRRATDSFGFTLTMLQHLPGDITEQFRSHVNDNLVNTVLPADWTKAWLIPIQKRKTALDPTDPAMWRCICGIPSQTKFIERVIADRLAAEIVGGPADILGHPIFGAPGTSLEDAVHTVHHTHMRARRAGTTLITAFVDIRQAFDRIRRDVLITELHKVIPNSTALPLLQRVYANATYEVRAPDMTISETFPAMRGIRQGSPVSPILFAVTTALILNELACNLQDVVPQPGLVWDGYRIVAVTYVDDWVIFAKSTTQLVVILGELVCILHRWGLELDLPSEDVYTIESGTKHKLFLWASCSVQDRIELPGGKWHAYLPNDAHIPWLGMCLNVDGEWSADLQRRVRKAQGLMFAKLQVITSKSASLRTRLRYIWMTIATAVLSGSAARDWTKEDECCIDHAMRKVVVRALAWLPRGAAESWIDYWKRQKDRVDSVLLPAWSVLARKSVWRWTGHTARNPQSWVNRAAKWQPGRWKRGRPRIMQCDRVIAWCHKHFTKQWHDIAQCRTTWRKLADTYASRLTPSYKECQMVEGMSSVGAGARELRSNEGVVEEVLQRIRYPLHRADMLW